LTRDYRGILGTIAAVRMENVNNPGNVIDWDRLLGKFPAASPQRNSSANIAGKRVLVTGAAGGIGSALASAIAHCDPGQLVLLDASEHGLYNLEHSMAAHSATSRDEMVLGNAGDRDMLTALLHLYKPQIVFHAAAFKHVPIMERNPFAAVANNALATYDLSLAAAAFGCEQMVLISTDKAADPLSIMGASKRIAELAILSSHHPKTRMKAVRLGNVLGSPGSIVPLFLRQIASREPVTVTHPDASRYFMTVDEVVAALLSAASPAYSAGLYVPGLRRPIRVQDLAKHLIASSNHSTADAPRIVFTALRPGDKLEETLLSRRETWAVLAGSCNEGESLRQVVSPCPPLQEFTAYMDELRDAVQLRDLDRMIEAVLLLVPEYQPSSFIASQRQPSGRTGLGVAS
jgi:FlaA1/EpsC-like NDP-sugar epimerase